MCDILSSRNKIPNSCNMIQIFIYFVMTSEIVQGLIEEVPPPIIDMNYTDLHGVHYNFSNHIYSRNSPNIDTLQYVIVMTRHGSRSPAFTYPNDPYPYTNTSLWPEGKLELTRFGKQQMYRTGQLLRFRYRNFLNEDYRPEENKIISKKVNRVFMSAACLLAGLYPPKGYQIWNKQIYWQPIPIWEDSLDNNTYCNRYDLEMKKALSEIKKDKYKYEDLLNYLSLHMGTEIKDVTEIKNVWDVLHLQNQNGYELPDWAKAVYPDVLSPLHSIALKASMSWNPTMTRLTTGPLLKVISDSIRTKAKECTQEKLFVHASHDYTLQGLFSALGFESTFSIDTSAFMIFELHKSPSAGFSLQFLFYNNSAHVIPNVLDPPNCPVPCSLEDFNNFANSLIPQNREAECQTTNEDESSES